MESNFHALSRWFLCYYFCLKPCYLCSLFYCTSLFPWQQDRMRRWVATGSWENGNAMESSTWNNNMQITLAYDKQQRKWYFFGGRQLIWFLECAHFSDSFSFLLSFLPSSFFWDQNKIIKGQKKIQPDIARDSMADVVVCASRDSSWAEHLKRFLIGKWIWLLTLELPFIIRM